MNSLYMVTPVLSSWVISWLFLGQGLHSWLCIVRLFRSCIDHLIFVHSLLSFDFTLWNIFFWVYVAICEIARSWPEALSIYGFPTEEYFSHFFSPTKRKTGNNWCMEVNLVVSHWVQHLYLAGIRSYLKFWWQVHLATAEMVSFLIRSRWQYCLLY